MVSAFGLQGAIARRTPWLAIAAIALLTSVFAAGYLLDAGPAQDQAASFLPADSKLAQAQARIAEDFSSASTAIPVQVIYRGDVVGPAAFQEMLDSLRAVSNDETVAPWLAASAVVSPAHILQPIFGDASPGDLSPAEFADAIADARQQPAFAPLLAAADGLLAGDLDGAIGAMAVVNLDSAAGPDGADPSLVQLRIEEVLDDYGFETIEGRSFSSAKLAQESSESQGSSTAILMGLALAIILMVLVVFFRNGADVAFSILGLLITVVWVFGIQGLLGPGGAGIIGADNPLAMMIPVLLIGLTVDYALQLTGRYREALSAGKHAREAIEHAVKASGMPLFLAAGTTMIAFFTNISSSLPPMRDFGIIAGIGVLSGWFVMTTLLPACRTLIDRRRERLGKPLQQRSMAEAIPGIGRAIGGLSKTIVRHPALILAAVALVSVASFIGASNVSTTFSQTDFLPENTETYQDLEFLAEHFAGGGGAATLLIEGDLTSSETLRDLVNLELGLRDVRTRPIGVTGPVQASFMTLAFDWAEDSGLPGDRYDESVGPMIMALDRFFPAAEDVRALLNHLQQIDPEGLREVVAMHPGEDRTIIRIPVVSGDAAQTSRLVADLNTLWGGDEDAFFITGGDILTNAVTDEMTSSQLESIVLTIVAALVVLTVFFGITERRPLLGAIAVLPIGLVVGWVLGSMFVLGISYNVMTALITALTIGVGVDYTIHITHRFLEELDENKGIFHAVDEAMRTTGGALLGSALTTALGFGVLLFSPMAPMQQFGGLTALTILYSLVAAFIVLPPMLVLWALYHEWYERQFIQWRLAPKGILTATENAVRVVAETAGRTLACPACDTRAFVPDAVARMECPQCQKTGRNPRYLQA